MYNVHVYGVLVLKLLEVINTLHVRNVFTMQIYNIFMYRSQFRSHDNNIHLGDKNCVICHTHLRQNKSSCDLNWVTTGM